MRASVLALVVLAGAVVGCGHAEQQRKAQEYERFLKASLGTVATDTPLISARADAAADPASD